MDSKFDEHENENVTPEKPTVEEAFQALKTAETEIIPAKAYYGLSGLTLAQMEQMAPAWGQLPVDLRRRLLTELAEASELNFDLDYRELGLFALQDENGAVRAAAIEVLWLDESLELMSKLIDMSQWDEDTEVRAAAVGALGRFILLGEFEEIPEQEATQAQDAAINLLTNEQEDLEVRRRALEAISNSSHEIVNDAIQEAYDSPERLMRVSSIFAMGRSSDRKWRELVIKELGSEDEEIRFEAARAAGELQLPEAVMMLGQMAVQENGEIREMAIWSLGEIGGREALRILTALSEDAEEQDDEVLIEAIEDAISNATLVGELVELELDVDDEDY